MGLSQLRLLESESHIFSSILRKLRNKPTASDSWCVNQLKLLTGDNAMSSLYTDSSYLICSIVNYFLCNSKIVKIRLIRQMFEIFFSPSLTLSLRDSGEWPRQQQRDKDTFTIYLFVILVYYRSYYSFKVFVKDLIVTLLIS